MPVHGQGFDPLKKPVTMVPSNRWGDLQPVSIMGDLSWWNFGSTPGPTHTFFHDLDIENNYLFTTTGRGMQVWDLRTTPPTKKGTLYTDSRTVPSWNQSDEKFYLYGIDAPEGVDSVAAVAAIGANGFMVMNTSAKEHPYVSYQDIGKDGKQVWATTYNGTHYAFYGTQRHNVLVYNLSAAMSLSKCLDASPTTTNCKDAQNRKVYVGQIKTSSGVPYLHGTGDFLATSLGSGIEIWKVNDPANAQMVMKFSPGGISRGVALWKEGTKHYLAVIDGGNATGGFLRIYDVSCITSGGCSAGTLVSTTTLVSGAPIFYLSFSRHAGSTPFLFLGGDDYFAPGAQKEFLFDVSNPVQPVDVTPKTHASGYWGWYNPGNAGTGFNWVNSRTAKFNGENLYRAAFSLLDIHKHIGNAPPSANFTWSPSIVYAGDDVSFTDLSTGKGINSWSWTFQDGDPATAAVKIPAPVKFATPGAKTVTLSINGGVSSRPQTLTVLPPQPLVGGISVSPANAKVCQPVTLTSTGVGGKAPLAYSWRIDDASGNQVPGVTGTGASLTWNTALPLAQAGNYKATVTVSNASGNASKETTFSLVNPEGLPTAAFAPTTDAYSAGIVTFNVTASGATAWNWDFDGDGLFNEADWTSNPVTGPKPTFTYTSLGQRNVRVKVANCLNPQGVVSDPILVDIKKLVNLKAEFAAQCSFGFCAFSVNQQINFDDFSTGNPTVYEYDWNGDGTFEQTSTTKVTQHAYATAGKYRPKLRVGLASGEKSPVYELPQELNIVQVTQQIPQITVTGPTSGKPAETLSFAAQASNCTASASGWTWDVNGGTVSGSSNGSSIAVSWSSAGSKIVKASNTGCGVSVVGTRGVTISEGNGGGGNPTPTTLKANFTYAPLAVDVNQPVSFDGSSSTGNPTSYAWSFGDNTATAAGAQTTHTFAAKGTYVVTLTVTAPGSCPPAPFCSNLVQKTIVVGTAAPTLAASFTSDICTANLNFVLCKTDVNKEVTFSDTSTGQIASRTWDFGDGESATGNSVKHVYKKAGSWPLTLTIRDASNNVATLSRNVVVNGPLTEAMVLPWLAKTVDGALVQSSDLYLHNPGAVEIEVSLEFRRRGTPENQPPKTTRKIAPNATLFVADVVKEMFGRENVTGFLSVRVDKGDIQPVVTSFNTTLQADGSEFGQTIPGFTVSNTGASSSTGNAQVQNLVGLNDNNERMAYFGISNPSDQAATYRLRFYDAQGDAVGTTSELFTLSPNGAKQFQVKDIRTLFGVSDQDDYRLVVESDKGTAIFPYAANLRLGSNDPSFVSVGTGASRVYLLGALSTPGLNNSLWQSDVVLANTSNEVVITELTFTGVGAATNATDVVRETLQAGETRRLADVIGAKWNIRNAVGVLTIDSDAPGGLFPIIQGESYENTNPAKRYGQTLPALTDKQAAGNGQGHYLVGLRQDAKYRTTFWMLNPGTQSGQYDVVFRALDGRELGKVSNVSLAPGKLRQFNQSQFPAGVQDGFTVQIIVKSGKVLASAQVVNNRTNDPAYIQGETR